MRKFHFCTNSFLSTKIYISKMQPHDSTLISTLNLNENLNFPLVISLGHLLQSH